MIIENETAELLKTFCYGEYLQVICNRCDRIMIERDEFEIEMIKSPHLDGVFMTMKVSIHHFHWLPIVIQIHPLFVHLKLI